MKAVRARSFNCADDRVVLARACRNDELRLEQGRVELLELAELSVVRGCHLVRADADRIELALCRV